MTNVVDLHAERNARERPESDCVHVDQYGQEMFRYAIEYQMDGCTWGSDIWAYSWGDAESRVTAMRDSLTVIGQIKAIVPA